MRGPHWWRAHRGTRGPGRDDASDGPGVGFIRYIGTIVGIIAVVQAVALSGRAGSAEAGGLLETLRGTGMSSARVLATWWATASAGALASLGTAAALMAVVGDRVLDVSPADTVRLVLGQWPAAAAAAGLCVLCAGLAPAARHLAWAPVLASALIAELGGVLDLPQAVRDEAPFAQAGRWTSLWLLVVALAGLAGGALLIRSRDLRPR